MLDGYILKPLPARRAFMKPYNITFKNLYRKYFGKQY